MTDDEHHTRGGKRDALTPSMPPATQAHSLRLLSARLSFYQFAKSQSHDSITHHFLFQWKISLKINTLWLEAAKKNRSFNRKIHKGFKYQGHQLLGYFQGLQGVLLLNPLRRKSNKWISLTWSWELGPITPKGSFTALLPAFHYKGIHWVHLEKNPRGTKAVCPEKQIKTDMPLC